MSFRDKLAPCLICGSILCALVWTTPTQGGVVVTKKISWTVGKYLFDGREYDIHFKDAHLKLATRGDLVDPAPDFGLGGFTANHTSPVKGDPEDCIVVDWNVGAGVAALVGEQTLSGSFSYDTKDDKTVDVKVLESRLTGVTIPDAGFTGELNQIYVPGPGGVRDATKKAGEEEKLQADAVSYSVDWSFKNDLPAFTPPVSYSLVEFLKTLTEPAATDLTAAGLVGLGAMHLQFEPDFSLAPGAEHLVNVEGVDPGDWLIARYTASWEDPLLSSLAGSPVTLVVPTYLAVQVVPEPSTWMLAMGGLICLLIGRKSIRGRR